MNEFSFQENLQGISFEYTCNTSNVHDNSLARLYITKKRIYFKFNIYKHNGHLKLTAFFMCQKESRKRISHVLIFSSF